MTTRTDNPYADYRNDQAERYHSDYLDWSKIECKVCERVVHEHNFCYPEDMCNQCVTDMYSAD